MTLQIEVGKWYRTRDGGTVWIERVEPTCVVANTGEMYYSNGRYSYVTETPYDLVSEIESENVPVFEPAPVEKEHVWYIEERFVDGEIKSSYTRTLTEDGVRACVENLLHSEPRIDTVAVFRQEFVAKRKTTVEFT